MFAEHRPSASEPEFWSDHFLTQAKHSTKPFYLSLFTLNRLISDKRWRAIRDNLAPESRILDAGCGLGQWVHFLYSRGYSPIGLDYAQPLIDAVREVYPEQEWVQGSVQELPFEDHSLDGIISWGVIEHDESGPKAALEEFHRVLRPSGVVVLTVPINSPAMRANSPDKGPDTQFYQYFFAPDELKNELENVGFEVMSVEPSERHYSVVFPQLHAKLKGRGHFVEAIIGLMLRPLLWMMPKSASMLLAVARRA